MAAQCLSVIPCRSREVCTYCQTEYDTEMLREKAHAIQAAVRLLEYYGFTVTAPKAR